VRAQRGHLIPVFTVVCVMCGRSAGWVIDGRFVLGAAEHAPAMGKSGPRCGVCEGNLYLEPDESVTPFAATQLTRGRVSPLQAA
jgi:hypothetical protein